MSGDVFIAPVGTDTRNLHQWRRLGTAAEPLTITATDTGDFRPINTGYLGNYSVSFHIDHLDWRTMGYAFGIWPRQWLRAVRRRRRVPCNAAYWQAKYAEVR